MKFEWFGFLVEMSILRLGRQEPIKAPRRDFQKERSPVCFMEKSVLGPLSDLICIAWKKARSIRRDGF